jgi:thiamine-phosphate pyrophosphorylase
MGSLPRLMLITDLASCGEGGPLERVAAAVRGGVGVVQLRDRAAGVAELLERAQALRRALPGTHLLINDRADLVLATCADGVQLPAAGLPVAAARRLLGPAALVGRSVHSVAEAQAAEVEGADFLLVGTVYATASHPGKVPEGPALLEAVAAAVRLPFYAVGGITAANAADCIRRGAHGIAVIRAITEAADPEAAAHQLLAAVEAAAGQDIRGKTCASRGGLP